MVLPAGLFNVNGIPYLSTGMTYAPLHENFSTIGANNVVDFLDPTPMGTERLNTRLLAADISSQMNRFTMATPYFSIYDCGI